MKYTTLLWDLDGTLLDFLYSQRIALTKCFEAFGRSISEEELNLYSEINDSYWKKYELGEVSREELLVKRFVTFFEKAAIEDIDPVVLKGMYEKTLGCVFSYTQNAPEVVESFAGKVKQYIVTNGIAKTQHNKIELSGLDKFCNGVFISEEVGSPKPAKEFFNYVFEHIEEKDKARILIIGDSLSSDIKGGILNGIKTCWYRPEGTVNTSDYIADYEIADLKELYNII